jgi:predicted membrane-bound spermidine synthase
VRSLLRAFPDSHDQWIEFNNDARAYVDLRDPEARNVFLKRSFEPDFFRIARAVLFDGGSILIVAQTSVCARSACCLR